MAGNQTLLVEVDWSSKSGSTDSTIAFNETFDISLKGISNFGQGSNVRLVLSTAQTGLEASNILYIISKAPALDDGALRISGLRVATPEVLDTLNQQGGKGNFYLFVMEERSDGSLVDFGSCRVKMTLGGYTEDAALPENIEGMPSIKELQDSIATINSSKAAAENAAKRAEDAAKSLSDEFPSLRQTANEAKAAAEAAEATAEKAETIAKGAQYAKVFNTEAEMKAWAAAAMAKAEDQREVKVGDNLYIEELEVPDYWWTGEGDGYAQLETGAVRIKVDTSLDANSTNPVQNKVVKAALDVIDSRSTQNRRAYDVNPLQRTMVFKYPQDLPGDSWLATPVSTAIVVTDPNGSRTHGIEVVGRGSEGGFLSLGTAYKNVSDKYQISFGDFRDRLEAVPNKQDRLIDAAKRVNNLGGKDPDNENECATLENISSVTAFVGKVKDFGISGEKIKLRKMTMFRHSGATSNATIALQLKVCRWIDGQWLVAFYSTEGKAHGNFSLNGQRIEYEMATMGEYGVLSEDERILIIFNDDVLPDGTGMYQIGCKSVAKSGVYALTQMDTPTTENPTSSYQYALALDVEYVCKVTVEALLEGKQENLTAGENITIENGVISATGGGVEFPLVVPQGNCIDFGGAELTTYTESAECYAADVRFNMNGGVLCVESGDFSLGNGANFTAGNFRATANELGCLLCGINSAGGMSASVNDGSPVITGGDLTLELANLGCTASDVVYILANQYGATIPKKCVTDSLCSRIFSLERGGGDGGTPYLAIDTDGAAPLVGAESIAMGGGVDNFCYARNITIGDGSTAHGNDGIILGQSSCSTADWQIIIGHEVDGGSDLRNATQSYPNPVMFQACRTGVFFTHDACNNYATMIGFKNSAGCYEAKRIEDAFTGSGGDSYIKSSQTGTPYDIPGCSSGIAIGPYACIGYEVANGLAIGIGVEATSLTPVRIGSGCTAITVNNKYELCVGGNPVGGGSGSGGNSVDMADAPFVSDIFCNDFRDNPNGYAAVYDTDEYKGIGAGFVNGTPVIRWNTGSAIYTYPLGGGSSNDSICVYDSEGYCATGIGSDYVAIGDESTAYTDAVAVGASAYACTGEVAIGIGAGNDSVINGFITENSLFNVRRFRACSSDSGNELFFATKDNKAVLGGEFGLATDGAGTAVPSLCYFYLQDVADMLADVGGGGYSVASSDDGALSYWGGGTLDENDAVVDGIQIFMNILTAFHNKTAVHTYAMWGVNEKSAALEQLTYAYDQTSVLYNSLSGIFTRLNAIETKLGIAASVSDAGDEPI